MAGEGEDNTEIRVEKRTYQPQSMKLRKPLERCCFIFLEIIYSLFPLYLLQIFSNRGNSHSEQPFHGLVGLSIIAHAHMSMQAGNMDFINTRSE